MTLTSVTTSGRKETEGYWRKRYDLNYAFLDAMGVPDEFGEYPITIPQLQEVLRNCERALKEEKEEVTLGDTREEEIDFLEGTVFCLKRCIEQGDVEYKYFYCCG